MKNVRKVQLQPAYGIMLGRRYHRLRLPRRLTSDHTTQYSVDAHIHVHSNDTFRINHAQNATHMHILEASGHPGIMYHHFYQIMFPVSLSGMLCNGDVVHVQYRNNIPYLKFECDVLC